MGWLMAIPASPTNMQTFAVDLFCGAGGLSYGMQKAGITIRGGVDIDPACKHPFEENVKADFYEYDVSDLTSDFVESLLMGGQARVLAGCAPCQPFSAYTRGSKIPNHQWQLLDKFGEIVGELQPEVVTMENVPRLVKHSVFNDFLSVLGSRGYCYNYYTVRCADYGVPQTRVRLVLLASRLGKIELVPPTHVNGQFVTVRDAIQALDGISAGDTSKSDPLHKSSGLSLRNLERIRNSTPGGTWRDWHDDLRAACHSRESGRTYPSVYGRMQWDQPAPTITTQFHGFGNGRFGHPTQDRAISLREGALLQTFPEDYSFVPDGNPVPIAPVARLIGNAVPVSLGEAIGRSIIAHLEGVNDSD
jgi:DNA (cytosine-5)-methyltransferase 1